MKRTRSSSASPGEKKTAIDRINCQTQAGKEAALLTGRLQNKYISNHRPARQLASSISSNGLESPLRMCTVRVLNQGNLI